jgi:hypothetical protein
MDSNTRSVAFGGAEFNRLELVVSAYEYPHATDYYDGNWLAVVVSVQCGGFKGSISCNLTTYEFVEFLKQTSGLLGGQKKSAEYNSLEDRIHLELREEGRGHYELLGMLRGDDLTTKLNFKLTLDQTQLRRTASEIASLLVVYPVRGQRDEA